MSNFEIMKKYKEIVVGIDQSYECTGISLIVEGELKSVGSVTFEGCKNNSQKRLMLRNKCEELANKYIPKCETFIVIVERIRLKSAGFISINYIKSMGALNSVIIDTFEKYNIPVYSVDTRSWKSKIIGTTKPKSNKYGIDPKKYPTILWVTNKGWKNLIKEYISGRKTKGVLKDKKGKYILNDNKADSICLGLYYYSDNPKLEIEK